MPNETERNHGRPSGTDTEPDIQPLPDGQRERNPSRPDEEEEGVE